jgi:hypothetical protein
MMSSILGVPACLYKWTNRSVYFGNKNWSRGVTKVVKNVFAPDFRFSKLRRGKWSPGLPKKQAIRRGHAIDRVLHQWVYGLPFNRSRLKEPKLVIQTFNALGWVPVHSQLAVAWPEARLATKIDLVLMDTSRNKLIVVEMKSGCGYRRVSHGMLRHIVPKVSNAPIHQHQLQVLMGKELLARNYERWSRADIECVLFYITADCEVELIREDEFEVIYSPRIDTILKNTS